MEKEQQGWVGISTEPVKIKDILESEMLNNALADPEILDFEDTNIPIEKHPHFTGIYGLTLEGCSQLDEVFDFTWFQLKNKKVEIEDLEVFDCEDKFSCLVATLKKDETILSFRKKLMSYDHYEQEFPEYKPHITICWFGEILSEDEKFIAKSTFEFLKGRKLSITGIEFDNPYYSENVDKLISLKFN